ncbi:hypothetical protein ABVK25_010782 [Lepraria finkii]|uniref:Uncharacterized protein n=1 Tax=Lepraria finkii TaxID=1340010 RepID=A0ABR4AT94_9LECA
MALRCRAINAATADAARQSLEEQISRMKTDELKKRALYGLLKLDQTEQTKAAQAEFERGLDREIIERLGIPGEKIKVVWADHPVRYEDVSAQPYARDMTNVDYVIGVIALGRHDDLPALGPDFVAQKPLESGWVFYWDGSAKVRYSGSGKSFALPLSFKK